MARTYNTTVLVVSIAAALIIGVAGYALISVVFPGTFISFRATPQSASTTTTPAGGGTTSTQNATATQGQVITAEPATRVTVQDVTLVNRLNGGELVLDIEGLVVGTRLIALSGTILDVEDLFVNGFSLTPDEAEVQDILGPSLAAVNARITSETGATELVIGKDFLDSILGDLGTNAAPGRGFVSKIDDLLGGTGQPPYDRAKGFLIGMLFAWMFSGGL